MDLKPNDALHGFIFNRTQPLAEIDGMALEATHLASGAKLLVLQNDDIDKSFSIGFRTPPQNDTGVFHILEHSVLCGSKKFPVKEPFVDLLKSSMQTFLNAMTFPDKTLYPVASTNNQDLENLMDVYLDAVFHPQIYQKPAIFSQEGWHYELVGADGDTPAVNSPEMMDASLVYNGVVFSEMKGALSDANSLLYDEIQRALFPDTCYGYESGGTPAAIPTLSYEDFLDEHRRHYRTDNAYIILYGNLDLDKTLAFLDQNYLTPVAGEIAAADQKREAEGKKPLKPRTIELQSPVATPLRSIPMVTAQENACAASAYVIGTAADRLRVTATDILLDALFGSNEAPLKKALLNRGIAHDIQASVADSIAQPFALITLARPQEDAAKTLDRVLKEEVQKLLSAGLDKSLIEAAISHSEFILREHELGMSDGVIYAIQAMAGWLYNDDGATDYLRYEDLFKSMREHLADDYFEKLLDSLFCSCDHRALVEIVPTASGDDPVADSLAAQAATLSEQDRMAIIEDEEALRKIQEAPDSPEALATLPRLHITDIGPAPQEPIYTYSDVTPLPCLRHSMATRGIVYAYRYYELNAVAFEELPYVTVLASLLGKLDTANHRAAALDTLIQDRLGTLAFSACNFGGKTNALEVFPYFLVKASALSSNGPYTATLVNEILNETSFTDSERIFNILQQRKIALEQFFINAGHSSATARLQSYISATGVLGEALGNVGYYQFLSELIENYDQRKEDLRHRLEELCHRICVDNRCIISFSGSEDDFDSFWKANPKLGRKSDAPNRLEIPLPEPKNEAFIVPSDVSYSAQGWDRRPLNQRFNGRWLVASRALTYDYLWNEVRVKGGAYGVGFSAKQLGDMAYYSYRDPHLDETLQTFNEAGAWISRFTPTQETLDGFIIATVATIDSPEKPKAMMQRQDAQFFCGYTPEERLAIRDEVLQCTGEQLRTCSKDLDTVAAKDLRCTFGNEEILRSSKLSWDYIKLMG